MIRVKNEYLGVFILLMIVGAAALLVGGLPPILLGVGAWISAWVFLFAAIQSMNMGEGFEDVMDGVDEVLGEIRVFKGEMAEILVTMYDLKREVGDEDNSGRSRRDGPVIETPGGEVS